MDTSALQNLSNERILSDLAHACRVERRSVVHVIRLLAEVDRRKLYAKRGYYSLYEYCTEELHYSENEAYFRIGVARAARRFPLILEMIERGELHLTGAARCAPQLTEENHRELLAACAHKTKREIEEILAARFPQPDIPDEIAEGVECGTSIQPLAEDRFAVSFSASRRCVELIERAKALSSHAKPRAALGELVEAALEAYAEKLEKQKFKTTDQPKAPPARPSEDPRHIPAHIKRAVYRRDGGRCTYVGCDGHRCNARSFLEFDHIVPVARGGKSIIENLRLRCRTHNQLTAKEELGDEYVELMAAGFRPVRRSRAPGHEASMAALMAMRPRGMETIELSTRARTSARRNEGTGCAPTSGAA